MINVEAQDNDREPQLPNPEDHQNRGHFPTDDAVTKLIWLAIMDIEDRRAFQRSREKGKPRGKRTAPPRMIEGQQIQGWHEALNALTIAYPHRIPVDAI